MSAGEELFGNVKRRGVRRRPGHLRPVGPPAASSPQAIARRAAIGIAQATLLASSAETGAHCRDVTRIADGLCLRLGVRGEERDLVLAAARLHDIGKVAIPDAILGKPAPLDPREWEIMRTHTIAGEEILVAVPELAEVAPLVRHSHERWDGCGYPDGLAGEEVPLASRIVLCADAFDAIRSDRPYRPGRPASAALREIRSHAGRQFEPDVVEALAELVGEAARPIRITAPGRRPRLRLVTAPSAT